MVNMNNFLIIKIFNGYFITCNNRVLLFKYFNNNFFKSLQIHY